MGSSGTGRLTDYSGTKKSKDGSGGSSGVDPCRKAFNAQLEDVERCAYYKEYRAPPKKGLAVKVIFDKRPAVSTSRGELIGYLPTSKNYLRGCLENGITYTGLVASSREKPTVAVTVDIGPAE